MHWQRQKVAAEQMRDRLRATTSSDASEAVDLMALTAGGTTAASTLQPHPRPADHLQAIKG